MRRGGGAQGGAQAFGRPAPSGATLTTTQDRGHALGRPAPSGAALTATQDRGRALGRSPASGAALAAAAVGECERQRQRQRHASGKPPRIEPGLQLHARQPYACIPASVWGATLRTILGSHTVSHPGRYVYPYPAICAQACDCMWAVKWPQACSGDGDGSSCWSSCCTDAGAGEAVPGPEPAVAHKAEESVAQEEEEEAEQETEEESTTPEFRILREGALEPEASRRATAPPRELSSSPLR